MSNLAVRVMPETIRSVNFTAITGTSYVGIGSAFDHPPHSYKWNNNTNVDLMLSWNGIDDHEFMPARSGFVNDIASNKNFPAGSFSISQGTRFYVREISAAPTSGDVYVTVFYGFNG